MDTSGNGRPATVVISPPPTPNGPLHVGHLAGPYVAADVAVRAARRRGERTISVCGLDDNQNYVLAAARAAGTSPEELRRHHARLIRDVLAKVRVEHDVFVEPAADPAYCSTVVRFLDELVASGSLPVQEWTAPACGPCGGTLHHAYASGRCPCGETASGGTCEACGGFLTAAGLVDPRCTRCGEPAAATVTVRGPVLRLEDHRELLMRTWCRASLPPRVRRVIDRLLAGALPTMPLAYPTDWGIALPGTPGHRLDVWAEMGLGYLCSVGRHLDPSAVSLAGHVAAWREVGSLWAFLGIDNAFYYAVMFPALFGLAGLPPELLGGLVVNEFYTLDGAKFSTSRRHAVWAQDFLAEHDPGLVRAFLCWDAPQPHASDFTLAGYAEATGGWPTPLRPVRTGAAGLDRAERALAYPHFDPALAARCLLAGGDRPVAPGDGDDRAAQLLAILTGEAGVAAAGPDEKTPPDDRDGHVRREPRMTHSLAHALAAACPGRVVTPDHPAYDSVRLLFNGMHDLRPQAVCLPRDVAEVQAAVRAARAAGVRTTVRGGGHNVAGYGSLDDGLVIDLRLMNRVTVDPRERVAAVGGGATWCDFDLATSAYRMATTGGTFDTTGVGGLTLGGGIGHIMGRYGLTCDNVVSYQLVTAAGEAIEVDAERDRDLSWALRGAGHNFGVVTEFRLRVHPLETLYGGYVAYPEREMGAAVRLFRELMLAAPDELTCTLLLERYGPAQGPAAVMSVAYCGTDEEYRAGLDKTLRSLDVLDWRVEQRTYVSMQLCLGRLPFGLRHYWSARCVGELPDELVETLVERFRAGRWVEPFNDTILIEPLNGAVRRVPPEASAVPFRSARFNITGMAIWKPRGADDEQVGWARSVAAAAEPYNSWGDGYVNYVADERGASSAGAGASRARQTFGPQAYARLARVKRRIDPDNFFRSNYNVQPAEPESGG